MFSLLFQLWVPQTESYFLNVQLVPGMAVLSGTLSMMSWSQVQNETLDPRLTVLRKQFSMAAMETLDNRGTSAPELIYQCNVACVYMGSPLIVFISGFLSKYGFF